VVADEVRKLAERTSTATKEIAEMIRSIQSETKNAVAAMQDGTKQVELGVESTSQAGGSLHDIIQMTEQVGDMIAHIATASTQQTAATEEINGNVEQIANIAKSTVTGAQQTSRALEDLSGLALNLKQVVGRFRLESSEPGEHQPGQVQNRTSQTEQSSSSSVDFSRVKMAHRSWRLRLRRFLDGRENLDSGKLASHRDCELGQWIYGGAMTQYGHLHSMQQLEKQHENMHALVRKVVELKHAGKTAEAEEQYARVVELAESVVAFLSKVETEVKRGQARTAAAGS